MSKSKSKLKKQPGFGRLGITRKVDESFFIGDSEITIVEVKRGRVQLSVHAPLEIEVLRNELRDRGIAFDQSAASIAAAAGQTS